MVAKKNSDTLMYVVITIILLIVIGYTLFISYYKITPPSEPKLFKPADGGRYQVPPSVLAPS
jgi:hypothetical protein